MDENSREVYYSARQAAEYTGKHINTIRRWIAQGKIDATRVGDLGHYSILKSQLFPGSSQTELRISA